jgi:hypothetical protein
MGKTTTSPAEQTQAEALRSRIAELEAENAEIAARTAATIAAAQERTYWLQRWQVNLDAVLARPGGERFLRLLGRLAPRR